jgi:hypothetical protein
MKIRPVGAELFHVDRETGRRTDKQTDRQTDRHDKANIRFSQFCEGVYKLAVFARNTETNQCEIILGILILCLQY